MVYDKPKQNYAYFKIEDSFAKAEDIGNGSTEKHIPFNPMISLRFPMVEYAEEEVIFFCDMAPSLVYSSKINPKDVSNEAIFRDIFLMMTIFTHKTVTNPWTGTGDVITGDFTAIDHVDTLSVNVHIYDASNPIDKTFIGVSLTRYGLKVEEEAGLLMEYWDWKAADVRDDDQVPDMDDNFDDQRFDNTTSGADGGFAFYDQVDGTHAGPFKASDITITKGDSALSGVLIKSWDMGIGLNNEYRYTTVARAPSIINYKPRNFIFTCDVIFTSEAALTEYLQLHSAKTKNTLKIQWATDKYIQCTNVYLAEIEGIDIPESGNILEGTLTYKGGADMAISMSWTGDITQDPDALITD